MEPQQTRETQSARVLALGGLAAGIVGGLYVLLSEREEEQPKTKLEVARKALEEAAERARQQAGTAEAGLAHSLREGRRRGRGSGKHVTKDARKAAERARAQAARDLEETQVKVRTMLLGAKGKGTERLKEFEKYGPEVRALAQEYLSRAESTLGTARQTGSKRAKVARKEAEKAQRELVAAIERARQEAPKKLHEVEAKVAPRVKDLEKQAVVAVEHGRERAQELRKRAEKDLLPEVKHTAERVKEQVEGQAKVAATVLEKGSAEAAHKLAQATETVETRAKDTGSAVAEGGRDLRSLLLWLALGGALIYGVFLNDEQRQKVRAYAERLFGEAKATVQDIQGQNGSFEQA